MGFRDFVNQMYRNQLILRALGCCPNRMCVYECKEKEIISYAWEEDGDWKINIRVKDDPTTLETVTLDEIDVLASDWYAVNMFIPANRIIALKTERGIFEGIRTGHNNVVLIGHNKCHCLFDFDLWAEINRL